MVWGDILNYTLQLDPVCLSEDTSFWSNSPACTVPLGHQISKSSAAWGSLDSHIPPKHHCNQTVSSNIKCSYAICLERLTIPWGRDKKLGWSFLGECPITNLLRHCFFILIPKNTCNCFPSGRVVPGRDQEHHTLQCWLGQAQRWQQVGHKFLRITDTPEEWSDHQVIGLRKGAWAKIPKCYLYLTTAKISRWFATDFNHNWASKGFKKAAAKNTAYKGHLSYYHNYHTI